MTFKWILILLVLSMFFLTAQSHIGGNYKGRSIPQGHPPHKGATSKPNSSSSNNTDNHPSDTEPDLSINTDELLEEKKQDITYNSNVLFFLDTFLENHFPEYTSPENKHLDFAEKLFFKSRTKNTAVKKMLHELRHIFTSTTNRQLSDIKKENARKRKVYQEKVASYKAKLKKWKKWKKTSLKLRTNQIKYLKKKHPSARYFNTEKYIRLAGSQYNKIVDIIFHLRYLGIKKTAIINGELTDYYLFSFPGSVPFIALLSLNPLKGIPKKKILSGKTFIVYGWLFKSRKISRKKNNFVAVIVDHFEGDNFLSLKSAADSRPEEPTKPIYRSNYFLTKTKNIIFSELKSRTALRQYIAGNVLKYADKIKITSEKIKILENVYQDLKTKCKGNSTTKFYNNYTKIKFPDHYLQLKYICSLIACHIDGSSGRSYMIKAVKRHNARLRKEADYNNKITRLQQKIDTAYQAYQRARNGFSTRAAVYGIIALGGALSIRLPFAENTRYEEVYKSNKSTFVGLGTGLIITSALCMCIDGMVIGARKKKHQDLKRKKNWGSFSFNKQHFYFSYNNRF